MNGREIEDPNDHREKREYGDAKDNHYNDSFVFIGFNSNTLLLSRLAFRNSGEVEVWLALYTGEIAFSNLYPFICDFLFLYFYIISLSLSLSDEHGCLKLKDENGKWKKMDAKERREEESVIEWGSLKMECERKGVWRLGYKGPLSSSLGYEVHNFSLYIYIDIDVCLSLSLSLFQLISKIFLSRANPLFVTHTYARRWTV